MPAPSLIFTCQMLFLTANQQCQSYEGNAVFVARTKMRTGSVLGYRVIIFRKLLCEVGVVKQLRTCKRWVSRSRGQRRCPSVQRGRSCVDWYMNLALSLHVTDCASWTSSDKVGMVTAVEMCLFCLRPFNRWIRRHYIFVLFVRLCDCVHTCALGQRHSRPVCCRFVLFDLYVLCLIFSLTSYIQ